VVNGFAMRADVDGAFRILNLMKQQRILPNSYTLTSLMSACLSAKKIMKAKQLLNDEKLFQLLDYRLTTRDKVALHGAYSIGLCQLHNQLWDRRDQMDPLLFDGNVIKLRDVYLYEAQLSLIGMERQSLTPDVATMNAFIQSLCVQYPSRVIDALSLIPTMKAINIRPDKFTYSILFTALGKYGYLNETFALFRTIDDNDSTSRGTRVLDTSAFNSLLRSFVSGTSPLDCIHLFQQLTSKNDTIGIIEDFVPDKITFTILFLSIVKHLSSMDSNYDSSRDAFDLSSTNADNDDDDDDDEYRQLSYVSNSIPINSGSSNIIKLNISSPLLKTYQKLSIVNLQLPTDDTFDDNDDADTVTSGKILQHQTVSSQLDSYLKSKREQATGQQQLKSSTSSSPLNIDRALLRLYKSMRDYYGISPDVTMIKTISSLFSSKQSSGNIFDAIDISNSNNRRISTDTARYIFEDLVILGVHPTEVRGLSLL